MIRLSIITPTRNRWPMLKRCIMSVRRAGKNQSYEHLVIDDASTDGTARLIKQEIGQDSRLKYYRLKKRQGFLVARNFGVVKAEGEWISFLDDDDEYLPEAVRVLTKLPMINKEMIMHYYAIVYQNEGGRFRGGFSPNSNWRIYQPTYEEVVLKTNLKGDMHRVIPRQLLLKYPFPSSNPGLETLYYANLAVKGFLPVYHQVPVVIVHQHQCQHNKLRHELDPLAFAYAYEQLIKKHYPVLKNSNQLFDYSMAVFACYLKLRRPKCIWWMLRSFYTNPVKFIRLAKMGFTREVRRDGEK